MDWLDADGCCSCCLMNVRVTAGVLAASRRRLVVFLFCWGAFFNSVQICPVSAKSFLNYARAVPLHEVFWNLVPIRALARILFWAKPRKTFKSQFCHTHLFPLCRYTVCVPESINPFFYFPSNNRKLKYNKCYSTWKAEQHYAHWNSSPEQTKQRLEMDNVDKLCIYMLYVRFSKVLANSNFSFQLAATLWWFTAAPKPLKIQVFLGSSSPQGSHRVQPLYSSGHN